MARQAVVGRPAETDRAWLITGALAFVGNVIGHNRNTPLPGILRIAVLGSILTNKPNPKDIDLLVAVADDVDLAPLAKIGRRLRGHAQQRNLGADVFLANPNGHYLGRICPWRECRPFIRQSCDAIHCGWRPHLHDDIGDIRLLDTLVSEPPLVLWPELRIRVPLPLDVTQGLITPLQSS